MAKTELLDQFRAARRVSTPLVQITTADPAAVVEALKGAINGSAPMLQWDCVRGIEGINPKGEIVAKALCAKDGDAAEMGNATAALIRLQQTPRGTITIALNLSAFWDNAEIQQAIWNLRDPYKSTERMLVGVGPRVAVPVALAHDVVVLHDPLPDRDELGAVLDTVLGAAGLPAIADGREHERVIDAIAGLSAFEADQAAAMSLHKAGVHLPSLRGLRRTTIEQTPGLSIYRGGETMADYGGGDAVGEYFVAAIEGREPAKAIALLDEVDKSFAGAGVLGGPGDNTGVAQFQHGAFLRWLEERKVRGTLWHGLPGCGKTWLAKCLAGQTDRELLLVDVGLMQSSGVGDSQARTAHALDVVDAVSQGQCLLIATCNSTATLSTELLRRLSHYGEWYFDLPLAEELAAIVGIKLRRYGLTVTADNPLPDMTGWTGAEVERCMWLAWNLRWPFVKAARYVVPLIVSAADRIARIRQQAEGAFLSAATGEYYTTSPKAAQPTGRRRIDLSDAIESAVAGAVLGGVKES